MSTFRINPVIIFGAKSLGRVALEIFTQNEVIVYGFLEEDAEWHGKEIDLIQVLGEPEDQAYLKLIGKKCDAFVAHDENEYRRSIIEILEKKRKVVPVNALHPQASLAETLEMGHGNLINHGVRIGAGCKVGSHVLLHSQAVIEQEVMLSDYVQVGAGSIINAGVEIGEEAFIGSGVTIIAGLSIGANARIGAGSVVMESVPKGATVMGNPAKALNI